MAYNFKSMPVGPFGEPEVKPDLSKLIRIWEKLRELNTGGYGGGIVARVKGWQGTSAKKTTDCSSFTSTVIAMAFSQTDNEPFEPVYDGGKALPADFYRFHCGYSAHDDSMTGTLKRFKIKLADWVWSESLGDSAGSVVWFNLGKRLDDPYRDLQRGDVLKIEWGSTDPKADGGGHATFCWDVHRGADGRVDAFQFVSSNGHHGAGGVGVSVCVTKADSRFVNADAGKYSKKQGRNVFTDVLEGKEYPEYAEYPWFAMPGVKPGSVDKKTFAAPASKIHIAYEGEYIWAKAIKCARLHGVGEAPAEKKPEEKKAAPAHHFSGESQPLPEKDPAPEKVKPTRVDQPKEQSTDFQLEVEQGLAALHRAKWIDSDPGSPDAINDDKSKAAIKEFQGKFGKLEKTGAADRKTRDCLRRVLGDAAHEEEIEQGLLRLHKAGKLKANPGVPDGILDGDSKAAVVEFQKKNGLDPDGIPGANTRKKLREVLETLDAPAPAFQPATETPAATSPDEDALRKKIVELALHEAKDLKVRTDVSACVDSGGRIDLYFKVATGKVPPHDSVGERQYCAAFSAYCYKSAGAQLKANPWVPSLLENCRKEGRIVSAPRPGDLFFFRTKGVAKDAKGQPHHVGLVARVEGGKIYTVEGNTYGAGATGKMNEWGVWEREYPIHGTSTNEFEAFASPVIPGKTTPPKPPPKEAPGPAAQAQSAAPLLLWGTNSAAPGDTVEIKLHAPGITASTAKIPVFLIDQNHFPHFVNDGSGVQEAHPGFARRFIEVPFAVPGTRFHARILLADKSWVETPDAITVIAGAGKPAPDTHTQPPAGPCEDCKPLQALIDDGSIAQKIRHGSKDKASVKAYQKHLLAFGYDLGNDRNGAGHKVDPADGDYGGMTIKATRQFFKEAGVAGVDPNALTVEMAKVVIRKCGERFRSANGPSAAAPAAPGKQVVSSRIKVGGKPFVQWFNEDFAPKKNRSSGYDIHSAKPKMMWPDFILSERNFKAVFDHIEVFSGRNGGTPLNEFLAYFCIFYNEVGGTFRPTTEGGGPSYAFGTQGNKASYNSKSSKGTAEKYQTRLAGDALKAQGTISTKEEVEAWNGKEYPDSAPEKVKVAANQCDFFKYRGHGFTQITWREGHKKYVDPALKDAAHPKSCEEMTTEELDEAMEEHPKVYLRAVYYEWHNGQVGQSLPKVNADPPVFSEVGWHVSGSPVYGTVFEMRCKDLLEAMNAAGYECT